MNKTIPKSESGTPLPGYIKIREEEKDQDNKNSFIIELVDVDKPKNRENSNEEKKHEIYSALKGIADMLILSDKPRPGLIRVADFGNGEGLYGTQDQIDLIRDLIDGGL